MKRLGVVVLPILSEIPIEGAYVLKRVHSCKHGDLFSVKAYKNKQILCQYVDMNK